MISEKEVRDELIKIKESNMNGHVDFEKGIYNQGQLDFGKYVLSGTQWRSVDDELPKLSQKVLLISDNIYREEIFTYDFYEDLDGYAQVFYWKSENMGRSEKISKNDLWMPLPTPPEGE